MERDEHHEEEHEHHHEEEHEHTEAHDMHFWLDPQYAIEVVHYIADVLGEIYPENRDLYQQNANNAVAKLKALDAELKTSLKDVQHTSYLVFHDAYQYLENRYGLNAVGSVTLEPNEPLTVNRIREIRAKMEETGATCLFREPQFSDKNITSITENMPVSIGVLDPLGSALAPGEELYFDLLKDVTEGLRDCLNK